MIYIVHSLNWLDPFKNKSMKNILVASDYEEFYRLLKEKTTDPGGASWVTFDSLFLKLCDESKIESVELVDMDLDDAMKLAPSASMVEDPENYTEWTEEEELEALQEMLKVVTHLKNTGALTEH